MFALCLLVISPLLPRAAGASFFDPGFIISEQELFNYQSMSANDVQVFLDGHAGILKTYADRDIDGIRKSAALIIASAASRHRISAAYLLTLLQKEQGLITDDSPKQSQLDWATGYAVCDDCDVDDPRLQKFKGFANQVDRAAWRTRYFVEHPDEFTFKPGERYNIDDQEVFIANGATAALYNYTPHLNGNRVFWKLFETWFRGTSHPDGTLLQGIGQAGVWLVKNGVRHGFANSTAFTSRYRREQIVAVSPSTLEQYPIGAPIKFAEYALVRLPSGRIYLIVGQQKRWIENEAAFRHLGFSSDEVEDGDEEDLAYFTDGTPINELTTQPLGALLQDPQTYGVYYVLDGVKYPLMAPELLTLNFNGLRVRKTTAEELNRYEKGAPVLLKDGLLVKAPTDPRVYVIANGRKLPIYSEYTFNALGYRWPNIQTVSGRLLEMHPEGELLRVEPLTDAELDQTIAPFAD